MKQLALILLLGALCAAGFWWLREEAPEATDPNAAAVPTPVIEPDRGERTTDLLPIEADDDGSTRDVAEVDAEENPKEHGHGAAAKRVARLRGRCVDSDGAGLADVIIWGMGLGARALSDEDGSFDLEVDLNGRDERSRSYSFRRDGHASVDVPARLLVDQTTDVGAVVLQLAARISGRVRDANGNAVEGAQVNLEEWRVGSSGSRFTGPRRVIATGMVAEDGTFLMEGVPPGECRVWAGAEGWLWTTDGNALDVAPGAFVEGVEIVLEPLAPEDTIELLVVDPSGAPVPDARVSYRYKLGGRSGSGGQDTDEDGRLRMFLDVRAAYSFQASDPEDKFAPAIAHDVAPGTHDLVLQLGEKTAFQLFVHDQFNAAVEHFDASVTLTDGDFSTLYRAKPSKDKKDALAPGVVEIPTPPDEFSILVIADGFENGELGPYAPNSVPARIELQLRGLPGIRGKVTTAEGPLANARVTLHAAVGETERLDVNGFAVQSSASPKASTSTDETGEYTLTLRSAGQWYVRVEADGFAPSVVGPLFFEPSRGARGIDLELSGGGSIAGRIIVPSGEELSGHIVGFSRGDGFGFTQRSDAKGEYFADHLTPGPWQVLWRQEEIRSGSTTSSRSSGEGPREFEWSCEVVEGRTTNYDLDLRELRAATLDGRFLLGGVAPRNWHVTLEPEDESSAESVKTFLDAEGRYQLVSTFTGACKLTLSGDVDGTQFYVRSGCQLERGVNTLEQDVPTGEIRGFAAPGTFGDDGSVSIISGDREDLFVWASIECDADGRFTLERFPAGAATVEYSTQDGTSGSKTIEVPVGDLIEVSLP